MRWSAEGIRGDASFKVTSSVYNTPMERKWLPVRVQVIEFYMELFRHFEDCGLSQRNHWHLFCLQYMFLPRIKEDLDRFRKAHNNRRIRTKGATPRQLMEQGRRSGDWPDHIKMSVPTFTEFVNTRFAKHEEAVGRGLNVRPRYCPLTPAELEEFTAEVRPLCLKDPVAVLQNRFFDALVVLSRYVAQVVPDPV